MAAKAEDRNSKRPDKAAKKKKILNAEKAARETKRAAEKKNG